MDRGPAGRLFDRLAARYDRGNRVISLGRDRAWKRRAVLAIDPALQGLHLDLGAGTGDLTRALPGAVLALDMSRPMLQAGTWPARALPVQGDARRLPVQDSTFDGCVSGFLLRNVPDIPAVLREVRRALKPGGRLAVLEIAYPRRTVPRMLFCAYFHGIMPFVAGVVTGKRAEYRYLSHSLRDFPPPADIAEMAEAVGFRSIGLYRSSWTGIFLLVVEKPAAPDPGVSAART